MALVGTATGVKYRVSAKIATAIHRSTNLFTGIIIIIIIIITSPSVTLREERKLSVFENKVLRGIFGPRRDEVTGDWRRLHND